MKKSINVHIFDLKYLKTCMDNHYQNMLVYREEYLRSKFDHEKLDGQINRAIKEGLQEFDCSHLKPNLQKEGGKKDLAGGE